MKPLLVALCAACAVLALGAKAKTPVWQPSPGHQQIAIWPGSAPDPLPAPGPEDMKSGGNIAGKPVIGIDNVATPTMTVYSPRGKNTGAAIVVFPGGGYKTLAIDLEGTEVCDWLTANGITCVVLKYRVPDSGPYWDAACNCHITPPAPWALQDAQRTIGLLRLHAAQYHIDPHKIGVLGFSAGGHMVANISTHFDKRAYAPVDDADKMSCRPDFAVALYPGHLWTDETGFALDPDIATHISKATPPTFLLQNEDDPVDNINNTLVYFIALKNAGVPVEMHVYAQGGHAFGLRPTNMPVTKWPTLVETWLETIGMVGK